MITADSRIEDLDRLLTTHNLMMSAVATHNLWTVSLDSRESHGESRGHYLGSGPSLFIALSRALKKLEVELSTPLEAAEAVETARSQVIRGKK